MVKQVSTVGEGRAQANSSQTVESQAEAAKSIYGEQAPSLNKQQNLMARRRSNSSNNTLQEPGWHPVS